MNAQIYDAISQGNAFSNPLPALSATSKALAISGKANASSIASSGNTQIQGALTAGGLTPTKLTQASTMYDTASTSITTLNTYGDRSVKEAYSRIGTSVSYKEGLKSIGREPNNCDLINNAFGVIQTLGKQWLGALESAMGTVTNLLGQLWDLVKQGVAASLPAIQALASQVSQALDTAMTAVSNVAQQITAGIAAELAHIEDMVGKCLNFSFANVIAEWMKDICAGGVINSIGSSDLKDALK